jgi:hypothetical protein
MYTKYEEGFWGSPESWREAMRQTLVTELNQGASYEAEIERAWQLTGIEFDAADPELVATQED